MPISQPIQKTEDVEHISLDRRQIKKSRLSFKKSRLSSPDSRVPLLEGTEVAGYLIGKVLGKGSFSVVYDGTELETGRHVAVKEYFPKRFAKRKRSGLISPMEGQKRVNFREGFKLFHSEAESLEKIDHPNVVNMYSLFRANRTAYMVYSNEGGRDLKWFLTSLNKPLDQELLYKVFLPILSALNCLHNTQILHLDIKPANILLQPTGKPLLLDFGGARSIHAEDRVGKTGIVTHGFAPPEQYGKDQVLGPWTDIYALAATMYFGIVGKMPRKSNGSSISPRIDILKYGRGYSSATLEAINRALSYEASMRFSSVDHFTEALLGGSDWLSLQDYETREMGYDRLMNVTENVYNSEVMVAA